MAMIDAGAGLVVGTVSADGEPRVVRAWATAVLDRDPLRIRVVMGADDETVVGNLAPGVVAVTGADVRTLRSVQLKGRVAAVEPATADDLQLLDEHAGRFFEAVHDVDGLPASLMRRMLPHRVIAFEVAVDETYDQSPGPTAGTTVTAAR